MGIEVRVNGEGRQNSLTSAVVTRRSSSGKDDRLVDWSIRQTLA